jgi:predicted CopG family antitoxin
MPLIRVSEQTHGRLVSLKHGGMSMGDVIDALLSSRERILEGLEVYDRERKAVEAKGAGHGPSPGGKEGEYVRPQKP